ncbi:ubiE/COQ5 methyltransferase [Branchiostoma belcheri]|nr:ubiE/COQ5 methyltransferase [Branchiostoma belcheri]
MAAPQNHDVSKEKVLGVTRTGIKPDEVLDFYKKWSKEYDKDLDGEEYGGPRKVAQTLAALLGNRRDARVLDVAAGTGLCGQELSSLGFSNLDALDASQDMLDVAKTKNVYKNFLKEFLGPNRLNIEDDTYDGITACGLFCDGHVGPDCLDQLIRVVKPGGFICIGLRETLLHTSENCKTLEPRMEALQGDGLWQRVSREVFPGYCVGFDGVVYVHKVL